MTRSTLGARPSHALQAAHPERQARSAVLCLAVLVSTGCTTGRLSPDPPAAIRLEGTWKLNRAASDDPQKIIDRLRDQAMKREERRSESPPVQSGGMRRRGGPGGGANDSPDDQIGDPAEAGSAHRGPNGFRGDPLQHSPVMHDLQSILSRGDFLTVRQSASEFVLDYGGYTREFTPGGHSVVSAEGGVADQVSGWKGNQYVIAVRPQMGPEEVEQYGLSPDGKELIVKLHVGSYDTSGFDLTRIYEPTTEIAPRALPTND